jgi:hypothetical protein
MKIPTREEYFKKLRSNSDYLAALKQAPTDADRKKIIGVVEHIVGTMFDALLPTLSVIKSDPDAAQKITEALKTGDGIIKESDGAPIVSGSKGQ